MIELTQGQKKVVAAGITCLAAAAVVFTVLLVGGAVLRFLDLASGAIVPVVTGIFLSLLFRPYYVWWLKRLRNPSVSVAVMLLTVFVPAGIFCWCFGAFVVDQASNLIAAAPAIYGKLLQWFNATFPRAQALLVQAGWDPNTLQHEYGAKWVLAGLGGLKYASGIVTWLLSLVFFVYFLTRPAVSGKDIVRQMPFLKEDSKKFVSSQINAFVDIMVNFFRRQVMINLVEGVMYGAGFMLVGLPYGFVLGFLLGFLNLIPFFGTVVCLPVALPLAYFGDGGSLARLVAVTSVWAVGQVLDGYLITPKIQGDSTGLGYAGVIFSFVFWGTAFHSLLGLLLAIPLSAFCLVFWRVLKSRYIKGVI